MLKEGKKTTTKKRKGVFGVGGKNCVYASSTPGNCYTTRKKKPEGSVGASGTRLFLTPGLCIFFPFFSGGLLGPVCV
jgi:hypothetical protein